MIQTIISVLGTILGTILGWSLNCLYENNVRKVKLCYSLQPANQDELTEHELRTKYSESDYCIEIYNVGTTPYLLEKFSLVYKKKIIVDCIIIDNNKAIMPYGSYTYHLNEQEYDCILHHCKKSDIKKCKVFSHDVAGKRCIGEIDLSLPHLQSNDCRY